MDERRILHVDMDAFFAAVEQRDAPALRGKPVLIGSRSPRSVVATASYEARAYGCRSAMPMAVALRLCPHAEVVPPRGAAYREASREVFALFEQITPHVMPMSVDEAWLDVTDVQRLRGDAVQIARDLRTAIHERVSLTASVGVAGNRFLAKLASDMDKPDGLTVIEAQDVDRILPPLPVRRLPGVGPKAEARLSRAGIHRVADLRRLGEGRLVALLGEAGERLFRLAHGIDDRPVVSDREVKSISQECTFHADVGEPEELGEVLRGQAEEVAARLRRAGRVARTVSLKIRDARFRTQTRAAPLDPPGNETARITAAAEAAFARWCRAGFRPVRLIGVALSNLEAPSAQMELFPDPTRTRDAGVDKAVDEIRRRFGKRAIRRGDSSPPGS